MSVSVISNNESRYFSTVSMSNLNVPFRLFPLTRDSERWMIRWLIRWIALSRKKKHDRLTGLRTRKFILPPWNKRGGFMQPLPSVFDMLQYLETILPSVESLWSSQQDKVYFMGSGATGGLWRHQKWSQSWILPRIRNQVKTARNGNFLSLTYKK